jgi:antitoxin component YwqK of YwqJK toxin-antitoxin module
MPVFRFFIFVGFLLSALLLAGQKQKQKQELPYTIPFELKHQNGQYKMRGFLFIQADFFNMEELIENKQFDSLYSEFYESGKMKVLTHYHQGIKNGLYEEWHENGKNKEQGTYVNDKKNGVYKIWYSNGNLQSETNYKNDKLNGIETQKYENGKLTSVIIYSEGKRSGSAKYFYPNGNKKIEANYRNDQEIGTHKLYYEDGTNKAIYNFATPEGLLEGFWLPNGIKTISEGNGVQEGFDTLRKVYFSYAYNEGKKNGKATLKYENNQVKETGDFLDNLRHGIWFYYDTEGILKHKIEYHKGLRVNQ